jgi:subtilisin family serine protease
VIAAAVIAAPPPSLVAPPASQAPRPDPQLPAQRHLSQIGWTPPPARGPRPLVAVLDTGVDAGAPDLAAVIAPGGRSFLPGRPDAGVDPDGHGTHVAGIIAALSGNGIGGSGVAAARILPVVIADGTGTTTTTSLVRGVRYAAARGARVINVSFGGRGYSRAEQEAIDSAVRQGALVVAAAGNSGALGGAEYPGAYRHVLAVGALGRSGRPIAISSRGPQVAIAAPGQDILSTAPRAVAGRAGDGLVARTGTSMAAAVVSGAAARLIARRPGLSAQQVWAILVETARDVPPAGPDVGSGAGALDLAAALAAAAPPPEDPEPNDDTRLAARTPPLLGGRGPVAAAVSGRVGSHADPRDGFRVVLRAGQTLTAELTGPSGADLDLALWRPGTPGRRRGPAFARIWLSGASLGPASDERLTLTAPAGGVYTLEVQGAGGAARYTLTARRGP